MRSGFSLLWALAEMAGRDVYVTTNVDGTSATFFGDTDGLVVCLRNWAIKRGPNPLWRIAENLLQDED